MRRQLPVLPPNSPTWWTTRDLAIHFGVSQSTVLAWAHRHHFRIGRNTPGSAGTYLISGQDVAAWLAKTQPTVAIMPVQHQPSTTIQQPRTVDNYAADLRKLGAMFARWGLPWPVAWPTWVGPFPTLDEV